MKHWPRDITRANVVAAAMRRAGLLHKVKYTRPRRCRALAKSSGQQCRRWAERGSKRCYLHSGRGKGW